MFGEGQSTAVANLTTHVGTGNCHVDFLSEAEQISQQGDDSSPGRILVGEDSDKFYFTGLVAVQPWLRRESMLERPWPRTTLLSSGPWTTSRLKSAINYYADGLEHQKAPIDDGEDGKDGTYDSDVSKGIDNNNTCVALPHGIKKYASDIAESEFAFVEIQSKEQVGGIASELPNLIKTPVSDVLKPVMKLMGSFLGETLVEPLKEQMGELTSSGMVDQINEGLTGALIKSLSKGIPTTTIETIPFVVSEGLAEALMLYVTEQVKNEITGPLANLLSMSLETTVPKEVNTEGATKMAERVSSATIHSLTRSVSHSMIPALVHTLTHSPLQDFYCYYCFHHKAYCQYCTYAPSQLYYSLYYAGFYSTYYGEYYSKQ